MKLMLILLLLLWDNVEFTLTHEECLQLPSVERAFVPDEYKKVQYQTGDVIYFSCDPGYTTGFNTTYKCTEEGWRAATYGQCVDMGTFSLLLGCARPPALKNGYVLNNSSYFYVNGDKVRYQCDHLYELEGRPYKTCSNGQWIGDLQCLIITCKLDPNPPVDTTYNPLNQMVFRPGQSVRISCGEKQWVKDRELQSAELTCQDTGRWDFDPVCRPVTCSKTAENVYSWESSWYSRNTVDIDKTVWYRCYREYKETSPTGRATCTRRGWEPNPLCKDRSCTKPLYKNAEMTDNYQKDKYQHNERVHFKCTYDPRVTFYVDCYYGDWTGSRRTCKAASLPQDQT